MIYQYNVHIFQISPSGIRHNHVSPIYYLIQWALSKSISYPVLHNYFNHAPNEAPVEVMDLIQFLPLIIIIICYWLDGHHSPITTTMSCFCPIKYEYFRNTSMVENYDHKGGVVHKGENRENIYHPLKVENGVYSFQILKIKKWKRGYIFSKSSPRFARGYFLKKFCGGVLIFAKCVLCFASFLPCKNPKSNQKYHTKKRRASGGGGIFFPKTRRFYFFLILIFEKWIRGYILFKLFPKKAGRITERGGFIHKRVVIHYMWRTSAKLDHF